MTKGRIFYGGSFDPVHNGHLAVAEYAGKHFPAYSLLIAPVFVPPHKNLSGLLSFEHRCAMAEKAFEGMENIEICDVEKNRSGKSYSFDTLHILEEKYPREEILLLIGGDSLLQLHTWYRAKDLARDFSLIVYPRPGQIITPEKLIKNSWTEEEAEKLCSCILEDVPLFPVSSTFIRSLYREGKQHEAEKYVPFPVAEYIRKNSLYTPFQKENSLKNT